MRTHSVEAQKNSLDFEIFLAQYFRKEADQDMDPLAGIVEGRTTEQIASALVALPVEERVIFALYYFEELTTEEICMVLDVEDHELSQKRTSALHLLQAELDRLPA